MLDEGIDVRDLRRGHLQQTGDQARVRGNVAKAPPIHRVGLGEGVHADRALFHARQRRDADMFCTIEKNVLIHLVGEHDEIMLDREICNNLQFVA
ncbi:Uncharacterised protein [Mycobacterium tuberculosis]|nr:Uncharacterised protein [Mycobacterium tuberculosis]